MSRKACRDCAYFVWRNNSDTSGSCLRSPPVVFGDIGDATFPDVQAIQWCGEWRSNTAGVGQKLYQLPNGQWITPSMVSAVAALGERDRYCNDGGVEFSPRVGVFFAPTGSPHIIPCDTNEAAEAMRDMIANDVNRLVGDSAK